jgi:hypothetical protein
MRKPGLARNTILRGKSEIVKKNYFLRPLVCEENMSSVHLPSKTLERAVLFHGFIYYPLFT